MEPAIFEPPSDIMGIRAAAKELGKAASTISRQVKGGLIPNRGTEAAPKVSLAEAREARADNLEPASSKPISFGAYRADHERVKAERAELELQRLKGLLVLKADAENFLATEAGKLRDTLLRAGRTLAVEWVGLTAREIEEKYTAFIESTLLAVALELDP